MSDDLIPQTASELLGPATSGRLRKSVVFSLSHEEADDGLGSVGCYRRNGRSDCGSCDARIRDVSVAVILVRPSSLRGKCEQY